MRALLACIKNIPNNIEAILLFSSQTFPVWVNDSIRSSKKAETSHSLQQTRVESGKLCYIVRYWSINSQKLLLIHNRLIRLLITVLEVIYTFSLKTTCCLIKDIPEGTCYNTPVTFNILREFRVCPHQYLFGYIT